MTTSRFRRVAGALAAAAIALVACGDDSATESTPVETASPTSEASSSVKVVASTTWTGAYAKLAGASDITVIAPTNILHPPDYDPKASDLLAVADADIVVYAEFEKFAQRLVESAGDATLFPLTLENTGKNIEAEVLRLAEQMGTTEAAKSNLAEFLPAIETLGKDAGGNVGAQAPKVVAQVFMAYWAQWAGLEPAGTFGPQPMSADDLAKLSALEPTLVFDNHHTPGGQAFEAEGTPRIELINYPGDDLDLVAVFQHNHDLIVKALKGEVEADPNVSVPAGGGHGQAHGHGDATPTTVGAHGHGDSSSTTTGG